MKQLLCPANGVVQLMDVPIPTIAPDELLIRMTLCGICGTDLMKVDSLTVIKTPVNPIHLGHEVVGVVEKAGAQVTLFQPGDRVAAFHHVPNYGSHLTRRGSHSMDLHYKQTDFDPGGFAEYIRLSAEHVQFATALIPDGMSEDRAVFAEPLACVLRALDRVSVTEGDRVLLVGVGAVGLLFVPLLRQMSASVFALDTRQERLDLAQQWGATAGILARPSGVFKDPASKGKALREAKADLVILTVLNQATLATALQAVRDGGTILLFGAKPETTIPLDMWQIWRRELNLITSYGGPPDLLPRAIAILQRDEFAFERTISHYFSLDDSARGFDLLRHGKASKVIIKGREGENKERSVSVG